ncbi:MAG: glycosyltransferase, partial [Zymomonas sp.]
MRLWLLHNKSWGQFMRSALFAVLGVFALVLGLSPAPSASASETGYTYFEIGDVAGPTPGRTEPGLMLMGGGEWSYDAWRWFLSQAGNGHIVILRASGDAEAGEEIYSKIGGAASVQTVIFDDRKAAEDPRILAMLDQADGIFLAGGDQANYVRFWKGTSVQKAINDHFFRMGYPLRSVDAEVPGIATVRALSQSRPASISIVIPTRDGLDVLEPCIASLLTYPDPFTDIVIVDNGSRQSKTLEFLADLAADTNRFTIVRDDGDFNFSRLINLGVSKARGDIICLLNNDTELLSANLYDRARAWFSISDVGIVGARLLYPDLTLQHFGVCVGIGDHGVADHLYLGIPDHQHKQFSKSRLLQQFSAVTAACLLVRKQDYIAAGGFDEGLAVAYNDVDFCLKIRQRGLKIICDPEIKLIHKESKSRGLDNTPSRTARLDREAAIIRERWGNTGLCDPFYSPRFTRKNSRFEQLAGSQQPLPW